MHKILSSSICCFAFTYAYPDSSSYWEFHPGRDEYSDKALLDLSYLNEDSAGETGFVRRSEDGASFVRGDGEEIRFWAVNSFVASQGMLALQDHAKFLAKRGVNMVRFHGQIPQAMREGGSLWEIDEVERQSLWQLVAAMRKEGIYVTFSPYFPHAVREEAAQRWEAPQDSPGLAGMIYFDPILQQAYKKWLRDVLVPVNPYTGLALKDDPALAMIQMQNEDSLLFWTFNNIRGREANLLGAKFGEFLENKYGSLSLARASWEGASAPSSIDNMEDDWDQAVIALSSIWNLTGDSNPGDAANRLTDQAQFLSQTMYDWHAEIGRYLQEEIGAPQLFNAGNWKTADPLLLDDLERYSYTAGDVIGVNRYVGALHQGKRNGWAVLAGDIFREEGVLTRPLELPVTLRQPYGFPYVISETLWVPPMWQQSEGPILMAAYQALTGIDISYWFAARETQWRAPGSANGHIPSIGKWFVSTPQQIGAFPAAALIFRKGLINEAPPVIVEHRSLEEIWARSTPLVAPIQGFDPNRDKAGLLTRLLGPSFSESRSISPYSFLTGPVMIVFNSNEPDYVHPELQSLVDEKAQVVDSSTGQLKWDWGAGVVVLNAPKAQGVVGDLSSRPSFDFLDITIKSDSVYATVIVVPMDDKVISESNQLLVQIGSAVRPSGWASSPTTHRSGPARIVTEFGQSPWAIDHVKASLTIRSEAELTEAMVVDANGMVERSIPISTEGVEIHLQLPSDALYVVIR